MASEYKPNFGVVTVTAATLTADAAAHGGVPIVLDRAAGTTVTLPAATGSGVLFEFIVKTTVTSNNHIIKVANATDTMAGVATLFQDAGDTTVGFASAGATADTITMNGTSTGGIVGAFVRVRDIAATLWAVEMVSDATGTEATPFSATV
jgi:hypothetical protein